MHTIPRYCIKVYHKSKHSSKQQLAGDVLTLTARSSMEMSINWLPALAASWLKN